MKNRKMLWILFLLTALMLSGCGARTGQDMYALPRRSKEFSQLQSAIDAAMYGLTYSAPRSGDNQQTVQMADLDGDGTDEYLVFAKGSGEKPLWVLIFKQEEDGTVRNMEVIGSNGLEFEQVEYVEFDDKPGCELVIGRQISDQVLRSVSVYTFTDGGAELLLLNSYSKFLTCDLDRDGKQELMVIRPGEVETQRGIAVLYSSRSGQIARSTETELSVDPASIRRIMPGKLQDGFPAVYVASAGEENTIITDVFAMQSGRFTNISFSGQADTTIQTLSNYYVYANDIDGDGVMELPSVITMKPVTGWQEDEQNFLLSWFSLNSRGLPREKLCTFHNYVGGWYIQLDTAWAGRVSIEKTGGSYKFYVWDEAYRVAEPLFTVYVFTGSTRDEDAVHDGRFALFRAEGVAYAAKLEESAPQYDITQDSLTNSFHLIRQDRKNGET